MCDAACQLPDCLHLLRLSQLGLENIVAPMGTALTEAQCRLIKRFVPRVVFLYDGDSAGIAAADKGVPIALAEGLQVAVAQLPEGEDPDSYVGEHGIDGLREIVDKAIPGFEHLVLNSVLPRTGARKGTQDAVVAARELAPVLASISDRAERNLYIRKLADILGLDERALVPLLADGPRRRSRVRATNPTAPHASGAASPRIASTPPPSSELNLLKLLLLVPEACAVYMAHDVGALLTHDGAREAADALAGRVEAEEKIDIASFIADVRDPGLKSVLYRSMADAPEFGDEWAETFAQLETTLKSGRLRREIQDLKLELRRAYLQRDDDEAGRLQIRNVQLQKQLQALKSSRG
ncbi:MAG: hypothetical protein CSA24_02095 [Deltaproteobacteria bacterium]|nr:MAG: hypothetical protein CSA24_02095 [Deltaproteobacteria bacterium]